MHDNISDNAFLCFYSQTTDNSTEETNNLTTIQPRDKENSIDHVSFPSVSPSNCVWKTCYLCRSARHLLRDVRRNIVQEEEYSSSALMSRLTEIRRSAVYWPALLDGRVLDLRWQFSWQGKITPDNRRISSTSRLYGCILNPLILVVQEDQTKKPKAQDSL